MTAITFFILSFIILIVPEINRFFKEKPVKFTVGNFIYLIFCLLFFGVGTYNVVKLDNSEESAKTNEGKALEKSDSLIVQNKRLDKNITELKEFIFKNITKDVDPPALEPTLDPNLLPILEYCPSPREPKIIKHEGEWVFQAQFCNTGKSPAYNFTYSTKIVLKKKNGNYLLITGEKISDDQILPGIVETYYIPIEWEKYKMDVDSIFLEDRIQFVHYKEKMPQPPIYRYFFGVNSQEFHIRSSNDFVKDWTFRAIRNLSNK